MITDLKSILKSVTASEVLPKQGVYLACDRTALLAYAFMRGIPYRVAEPTARPFFDKYGYSGLDLPGNIAKVASSFGDTATEAEVKSWLAVAEDTDRKTKREAAEAKATKARAERRAEHMVKIAAARGLKVAV